MTGPSVYADANRLIDATCDTFVTAGSAMEISTAPFPIELQSPVYVPSANGLAPKMPER